MNRRPLSGPSYPGSCSPCSPLPALDPQTSAAKDYIDFLDGLLRIVALVPPWPPTQLRNPKDIGFVEIKLGGVVVDQDGKEVLRLADHAVSFDLSRRMSVHAPSTSISSDAARGALSASMSLAASLRGDASEAQAAHASAEDELKDNFLESSAEVLPEPDWELAGGQVHLRQQSSSLWTGPAEGPAIPETHTAMAGGAFASLSFAYDPEAHKEAPMARRKRGAVGERLGFAEGQRGGSGYKLKEASGMGGNYSAPVKDVRRSESKLPLPSAYQETPRLKAIKAPSKTKTKIDERYLVRIAPEHWWKEARDDKGSREASVPIGIGAGGRGDGGPGLDGRAGDADGGERLPWGSARGARPSDVRACLLTCLLACVFVIHRSLR